MRRYHDPVEVRRRDESPEQFLWRGRLWQVRAVLAHWIETGPWWKAGMSRGAGQESHDLLAERELWRVEARRGPGPPASPDNSPDNSPEWGGVFDLAFSWDDGCWQLVGCED